MELASTSGTVDVLPLSKSVPQASIRGQKTKTKVPHAQTQPVVQVGSDTSVPSLQAIKYDQQIQAQADHRLRELADIAQTGSDNRGSTVLVIRSNLSVEVKLMCLFKPGLSGPMNLCCRAPLKSVLPMTNSQCPSGRLAFAAP